MKYFIAEGAAETARLIETISNVGNIYFTKFWAWNAQGMNDETIVVKNFPLRFHFMEDEWSYLKGMATR